MIVKRVFIFITLYLYSRMNRITRMDILNHFNEDSMDYSKPFFWATFVYYRRFYNASIDIHFYYTPIMIAAGLGESAIVRILIDYDADVSIKDINGRTALSIAEGENRTDIVNLLKQIYSE